MLIFSSPIFFLLCPKIHAPKTQGNTPVDLALGVEKLEALQRVLEQRGNHFLAQQPVPGPLPPSPFSFSRSMCFSTSNMEPAPRINTQS